MKANLDVAKRQIKQNLKSLAQENMCKTASTMILAVMIN